MASSIAGFMVTVRMTRLRGSTSLIVCAVCEAFRKKPRRALPAAFFAARYAAAMRINDESVTQGVIDELKADDNLDESTIAVAVREGIVHLVGTVPTNADRTDAEADAKKARGVLAVVNDLRVAELAR
jgi:BON domain